ncbi:MAG TPA: hypothetical protein VIH35_00885, partial [Kiritimatiellia bacterium]
MRPGPAKANLFDRSRLKLRPLAERKHDFDISRVRPLERVPVALPQIRDVAARMRRAKKSGASIVWMMGAHVLRSGVQRYLIDMMEHGYISVVALNGGGMIHDFELSLIGATTESVAQYISEGQFGLWEETGRIND